MSRAPAGGGRPRPGPASRGRRAQPPRASGTARASSLRLDGPAEIAPAERRWLRLATFAVAAAFGLAQIAIALGPHKIGDYFTETDFYGGYAIGARLIQHGHLDPSRYGVVGPLYEIVLALVGAVTRNLFAAAEAISIAASIGTMMMLADALARRVGERVGLAAALFFATNAWVFRFGTAASTDAFSIALEVFAVWLVIARRGSRGAFAAGMVAAAAFLTRYNAIALLPAGVIALWLEHGGRRRPLLYAAGFLAPVGPWVAWCLTHGATFSFQLHHNIAYEVFARSRGIVWDDYQKNLQPQFHNLWDVIRRDPPAVFGRMLFNLTDHIRLDAVNLLGVPVTILVVLGLALALATGSLVSIAPFALAGVLLFLTLVPAFYAERYQMAVLPFYATLAGLAVGLPRFALPVGARGVWLKALLAVIPLALALQSAIALERRALSQLPVEVLEAARVLRAEAHPGDAVIARKPHLAFHAGIEDIAFPFTNTIPELGKFTHEHHVRWLFVSWPEVETRPRYWHLLDTSGVMPGLTPRFVNRGHPAVLYEIGPEFGQLPAWFANDTLMTWHTARAQLMVFPRDAKALFSRALVERAWNRFDDARTDAETAATIDPRNAPAFLLLGDLALQRQDARAAADAFTHALRAQPSSVDARAGLGWAAVIVGDDAQAAESWRPVVTRVVDPNTLQRMAIVFHSVGDAASEAAAKARLREIGAGGRR